jgi:predicted phage terminase large subunit-like protein
MKLTADLIYGFTNSLLISRFDSPRPTPEFHLTLWDLMCSDHQKVAVAAPRGHAKSTAVTHCFALANICFRIKKFILIVSDTEGQAANFLNDIKNELTENEELISLFDIDRLVKDTATEIIISFKDGHEICILVKGSGQKVRGLKWRNTRPDLILGDDLENDEIVMNEERRYKFMRWFYGALLPCGSDEAQIRIIGTILHLDSLLENLMPSLTLESTQKRELVHYSTDEKRVWKSLRFRAHNEDFSEILWPERFNKNYFVQIRRDYLDRGFPEGYSQEYLNYPIDEETAYFKQRDFTPLSEHDGPEDFYIACDLAISEKKSRAFTVFAVAAVDSRGKLRFKEIVRFRGDSLRIIDELFRLQNIYKPECFFIEQENIARALGPVLNKSMQERDTYMNIVPMQATQDKIKRARALQARMRAGMVEFDTDAEWFPEFQQELLQFPRGKYLDQVDAAAWIALGLESIVDAPTKKEFEQEQLEDEIEESYDFFSYGQSNITGY